MNINDYFTKNEPVDEIEYEKRSSKITKPDGTVVFEMNGFYAPKNWSQTACDILAQKYFRKAGVPAHTRRVVEIGVPDWLSRSEPTKDTEFRGENHAQQIFTRMAGCWTYWGWKGGYFSSEKDAKNYQSEMIHMLANQMGAPNSPQWFNTGLHWACGIDSVSEGHYYVDPDTQRVVESKSSYERPQPHACFIQSVEDKLVGENSIMDLFEREARLFKYGSGTGTNFSKIRGEGEPLSGGGKSSGLMSFLKIGDAAAGAIKSGGTTRRAAKMVIVDADHPDIEKFIDWKMKEEQKVAALIKGSDQIEEMETFTDEWEGEAYRTVSGQNSNNTVRVTDGFMGNVVCVVKSDPDEGWNDKIERAERLLDKISYAAWACADPGIQFHDTINRWHTCPNDGEIRASNPCSEYMFLDDTACNLASLNLMKFVSHTGSRIIDAEAFEHAVRLWTLTLEISVHMAQFPSKAIAEKSHKFRTLGLGYANLGALLMSQGLAYDSNEGRELCAIITAAMTGIAYVTSAEMAKELKPFEGYENNKTEMASIIRKHAECAHMFADPEAFPGGGLASVALRAWDTARAGALRCGGYRNAQVTVLAPTGTIGLIMDCDTTGIEPDFALVKHKQLAGGGSMKIVNQSVGKALEKLGYDPSEIERIVEAVREGKHLPDMLKRNHGHRKVFHCANEISAEGHLKMMAAAQPFLSGAISKTINLPNSATVEDVKNAFIQSWELGLKAVAIYRDGCKLSQPLTNGGVTDSREPVTEIIELSEAETEIRESLNDLHSNIQELAAEPVRRKLPGKRGGYTQKATIGGHKIYLRTGEYADGSLGEIFLDTHKEGAAFRALMNSFAMAVSIGLQHGTPLEVFVDAFTFTRFDPSGPVQGHERIKTATSVVDYIFRDLAVSYLGREELAHTKRESVSENLAKAPPEGADHAHGVVTLEREKTLTDAEFAKARGFTGESCLECGNFTMVRNGTCLKCNTCGSTSGCS